MAFKKSSGLIINSLCIEPHNGISVEEQLSDCYRQFFETHLFSPYSKSSVIKQTIFISVENNSEYIQSKEKLLSCAKDFFEVVPPTSVITQSPDNISVVLELTILEGFESHEIIHRRNGNSSWICIESADMKMIIATGNGEDLLISDILEQSETAFRKIQDVLTEENMKFSDVVRQWNYIEQIIKIDTHNNASSQHYQIFNDVRSKYYQQANFSKGFPSATGIGMDCGGIVIDIIAVKTENPDSVIAIKSPVQLDAYAYSKEVLAENNSMKDFSRTTPKFERAKVLAFPENKWIFISGTAAIKGQVSIPILSVDHQTEMTIQNILSLISPENLKNHGINTAEEVRMNNIRVYVKHRNDIPEVRSVCLKHFPLTPTNYVVADICRPELLVEIEALAFIE
jgi:enamine deaminase RidA (YjgF/YER057c/UK114 family)